MSHNDRQAPTEVEGMYYAVPEPPTCFLRERRFKSMLSHAHRGLP